MIVASKSILDETKRIPELFLIDREIGRPYLKEPVIYGSQAWSRQLELPWAIEQIGPSKGLMILDVGSGASALPIYLARQGAMVVSVDPEMLVELPDGRVRRIKAGLPTLPFRDDSFDVVTCISVFEHLGTDIPGYFAELCRVARKSVVLTFDIAFGPLATSGLANSELKSLSRMVASPLIFPDDPLVPSKIEKGMWAKQIGVCLLGLDRPENGWPAVPMSNAQRAMIRIHRAVQKRVGFVFYLFRRLRSARLHRRRGTS